MLLSTKIIIAFFLSLVLVLASGTKTIGFMRKFQGKGQPIREDGPKSHLLNKKGTPTMGGFLILGSTILTTLICANIINPFIIASIVVLVVYGFVGFMDDYTKVKKQTSNAMTPKMKLLLQFSTAFIAILYISYHTPEALRYQLTFPYLKDLSLNLWYFYIPFAMIVIAGSSNAVNLTDGLDGLASGLLILSFGCFAAFAYHSNIPYANEAAILCISVVGSCLGFLWFNKKPAKIFMGDTGSLALGALIGIISVILKSEILLAIIGGVFVAETISVMIQVAYFKKTGKRFFKMAPIHHHFEQLGWPETKVVFTFWAIGFVLAVSGLLSI